METFLRAYYPTGHGSLKQVQIFGYTTNGIPGVEIVGLGRQGRTLKEKIIFFSKRLGLKLPIKRFVLCIEEEQIHLGDFSYLEFPFFFLFLNLAGILEIKSLENCLCSGRLLLNGNLLLPSDNSIAKLSQEGWTLLISNNSLTPQTRGQRFLIIEDIFLQQGIKIGIFLLK